MLDIFVSDIADARVIIDDYFVREWEREMITRDVDIYARRQYGEDICHIFGTDTIESMPEWDEDQYAAKVVRKLLIPREGFDENIENPVIQNYSFFIEAHIPDISSTAIKQIIPEYSTIHARFEESPKFIIPGLSKKISQYILKEKIYLQKPEKKPKILVHVCCGPDVTMPIIQLRDDYDIICFWYDPNIQPKAEYDKRYDAFVRICEIEHIPYIK